MPKAHPQSLYYSIASRSLEDANAEQDEFRVKQLLCTCVVFSAFTLEAFINEQYNCHGLSKYIKSEPLTDKWVKLPNRLGASKTFDVTSAPFTVFEELVNIRNNDFAHYKPATGSMRFLDIVWDLKLSTKLFSSVRQMIEELCTLLAGKIERPGFLTGRPYIATIWSNSTVPLG
jgi:hypothetical protein